MRTEETRTTIESIQDAAQAVGDQVSGAADCAAVAARNAGGRIAEFRAMVRSQPIAMAILMAATGYVVGRISGRTTAERVGGKRAA